MSEHHIKETSLNPHCLDDLVDDSININDLASADKSIYALVGSTIVLVVGSLVFRLLGLGV